MHQPKTLPTLHWYNEETGEIACLRLSPEQAPPATLRTSIMEKTTCKLCRQEVVRVIKKREAEEVAELQHE